jgi:thiol:disulfide interchange protein DsbA
MRHLLLALAAALLAGSTLASPTAPRNGVEYTTLDTAQPLEVSGKKAEVIEFFMYHCPACYALEPALLAWRKQRGDKVAFRRVHLPRQRENDPEARLFVTLEALGMADSLHAKVLQTWHVDRQRLASDADNLAWAVRNGIERARFTDAYNSFGTTTRLRNLPRTAINYQVESTPTIIVDGRYLTTPSMVAAANPGLAPEQVFNATLQVVDALIAKAAGKP